MTNFAKRSLAMVMALVLCISLFSSFAITTSAATVDYRYSSDGYIYNWGTRETEATFLSPNAETFYADNHVTYDALAALEGSSSISSVPDSDLYDALYSLMAHNHDYQTSYNATRPLFQYTDCQGNAKSTTKISSFYSGKAIGPAWDSGATWNREHCWPNSRSNGGSDSNTPRETDIMMLRPTAASENGSRSNTAYGESSSFYNPNSESNGAYDLRGDVARIVLYVYVRWGGDSTYHDGALNYMWGSKGAIESKEVLLKWMEEDTVDTWELARNDSVESITGTRNVFVDYPELAFLLFNEEVPEMTTPSGEAMTPDFVITPTVNNSAYGSVSLSGTTINATPAKGCEVAGYTLISGEAFVVQNGNAFTVTAVSDCTIQINFIAREEVTVTFVENGTTVSSEIAYVDDVITFNEPTEKLNDGYMFLGWVTDALEKTAQKPSNIYAVSESYTLTQDITFHALYSWVDTTTTDGNTYELATEITEGDYLIVADSGAMKAELNDKKNRFNYTDVTIINNHIDISDALTVWHIAPTADGYYTISNASTGSYAAGKGSNNVVTLLSAVTDYAKWKITFDGAGTPVITNLGNETKGVNHTLRKNSNNGFSLYNASTGSAPCLYVKTTHTMLYSTSMMDCFHINTKREGQIDATCTESGSTGKVICLDCGNQLEAAKPVAATGHKDANSDQICDSCGGLYNSYVKVTRLSAGDTVLLVCESAKAEFSSIAYNYGFGAEYDDLPEGVLPLTVVPGSISGTYAFKFGDAYLYWASGNTLITSNELNDNASWKVSFDEEGNAIICNAKDLNRQLQYSAPFFACDTATQTPVQLFGLVVVDTAACKHSNTELQNVVTESCTVNGYTGDEVCLDCGEIVNPGKVIAASDHNYEAVVTEPTLTEQGYTTYTCSACGDSYVGEYTAALAVAKIGETYYDDLNDALRCAKAGETVSLIADAEESYIIITPDVTLDLGAYTLTADYVIGLDGSAITASTYSTSKAYGVLDVAKENISLDVAAAKNASGVAVIPVWNGEEFVFAQVLVYTSGRFGKETLGLVVDAEKDQIGITFAVQASPAAESALLVNGTSDNEMSVVLRADWVTNEAALAQEFVYIDSYVGNAFNASDRLSLIANLTGYSKMDELQISAMIVTDNGIVVSVPFEMPS